MSMMKDNWSEAVLAFWFGELQPEDWFRKNEVLDARITERFLALYERLATTPVDRLYGPVRQVLATVIVLDQFPRNMFRGSPRSFESDSLALALAARAVADGADAALSIVERKFLYMPYQHSEDAAVQARSVALFAALGDENTLDYAHRHKDIIDRFGRFPHRNAVLGRTSGEEELAFLTQPGSSF